MAVPGLDEVLADVERRATATLVERPDADPQQVALTSLSGAYRDLPLPHPPDPVALGAIHEAVLARTPVWDGRALRMVAGSGRRKSQGSYFTPQRLVDHLLDETLEPVLDEVDDPYAVRVLDPACGAGLFLVSAARRIARRGVERHHLDEATAYRRAVRCLAGVDVDAAAVELARRILTSGWAKEEEAEQAEERSGHGTGTHLVVGDALLGVDWRSVFPRVFERRGGFDVVVGNPPFLGQLSTLTARRREDAALLEAQADGTLRPYTDLSAVFLQRSVGWSRLGGRIGLVQPQSLLAARDAAGVRRFLSDTCSLESLWASAEPVFEARVLTCAPVLRNGGGQGPVRRHHGRDFRRLPDSEAPDLSSEWSFLLAAGLGVPEVRLPRSTGVLADLAACTADFRDQYYGLAPYVREAADCPAGAPLVTSGLIEPAGCRWGRSPARYRKRRWDAPVVDLEALAADPGLARWAAARRVPKVLVGTQGRVIKAVADHAGEWLPSVPAITVTAPPEQVWHVLAVLLAPPVTAFAAATYAGTALSMRAVKLSARQVARLPLPEQGRAWEDAAALLARAQDGDKGALEAAAQAMCEAYGADDATASWWRDRL